MEETNLGGEGCHRWMRLSCVHEVIFGGGGCFWGRLSLVKEVNLNERFS